MNKPVADQVSGSHNREPSGTPAAELALIAERYETDKALHLHYLRNYEDLFADLRNTEIKLLELGVYRGGSLRMWRDFFQRGVIVGLDMHDVPVDDPTGRIRTYQGVQQDTALLDRIARELAPNGFDIIIDDCAHIGVLARASFWHLFDHHLKSGGFYVIEDWGTGYWDDWIDGVGYRRPSKIYHHNLHRLSRTVGRFQTTPWVRRLPFAKGVLSRLKAALIAPQYHSHDFGMVGFVKELIDELGMADITHREHGVGPYRTSKFSRMHLAHSHLLLVKA
jgi:hypothetical protein